MSLSRCEDCNGFAIDGACPLCGGSRARVTKLGALATLLGSSAFGMTLMACYGCPDGKCTDLSGVCGYQENEAGVGSYTGALLPNEAGAYVCVPSGDGGLTDAPPVADGGDASTD